LFVLVALAFLFSFSELSFRPTFWIFPYPFRQFFFFFPAPGPPPKTRVTPPPSFFFYFLEFHSLAQFLLWRSGPRFGPVLQPHVRVDPEFTRVTVHGTFFVFLLDSTPPRFLSAPPPPALFFIVAFRAPHLSRVICRSFRRLSERQSIFPRVQQRIRELVTLPGLAIPLACASFGPVCLFC